MKKKRSNALQVILIIIAIAIYFASAWLIIGPFIQMETRELQSKNTAENFVDQSEWSRQQFAKYRDTIAWYNEYLYQQQQITPDETHEPIDPETQSKQQENQQKAVEIREEIAQEMPYGDLFLEMTDYNHEIFENNQANFNSIESYSAQCLDVAKYGIKDDVVGSIYFPGIEVSFPLYLGGSMEHLNKGVAQLSQTSMPIGGTNTNCVVAGHRGWHNGKYLKDVEKIQVGQTLIVTTLWDVLHYEVKEIKIIMPNDIDAIKIQPGKDLLTIVTCHPYGSGGKYRYLLICERNEYEVIHTEIETDPAPTEIIQDPQTGETVIVTQEPAETTPKPADQQGTGIHIDSKGVEFESSQSAIFWDDFLHYVGFAFLLLLPISIIIYSIHNKRRKKKLAQKKHAPTLTRRQL